MKSFIVLAALVCVALADDSYLKPPNPEVVILKEIPSDNIGLSGYKFAYELSDGQKREESAQVEARANPEESVLRVTGSFSYVAPDGQTYTVNYIADENGFKPQSAHLSVAPVA